MKSFLILCGTAICFLSFGLTVSADSWSGSQYRWATTEDEGWPFNDDHFLAAFYGDEYDANNWILEHYHLFHAQDANDNQDIFNLERLILYNSVSDIRNVWNDHQYHDHSGTGHTESITRYFLANKHDTKITFEIVYHLKNPNGTIAETYVGDKWRDGSADGLSF